ncbi:clostripain-related cysteine peptidase [Mucilaginibacter psychrotolerans]|uniref:Uncharacterized protein n=1 Tax=Mucilaginibacter psychrotolerans TaxID=1524096 RepID=A0A4Y8SEZ9_9SPHI|nr:clostripain-related cysteine peptidase [Mucilaginibacter psychrotolerans]TFF37261.1 hypothetical protein E2R66_12555 [Mucilaginibacter psychrotolerans]
MKNSPDGQSNRWLIIFLIYADFTTNEKLPMIEKMKFMLNSMLGDIITTPINNQQARIFVIFNSIKYYPDVATSEVADKTAFYTFKNAADGTQNQIEDCEIIDNKEYYTQDGNGGNVLQRTVQLRAILEKTHVQDDEEILLITWDHGSSFGIFREGVRAAAVNNIRTEIYDRLEQYPFLKSFWDTATKKDKTLLENKLCGGSYTSIQVSNKLVKVENNRKNSAVINFHQKYDSKCYYDQQTEKITFITTGNAPAEELTLNQSGTIEQTHEAPSTNALVKSILEAKPGATEILKNTELDTALKEWLRNRNKKVGVLLMCNCWMMNLHTMYTLKNSVQCLVAPQGNIDYPGYNIKDILNYINRPAPGKTGTVGPAELAKICVETFDNNYSKAKAIMFNRDDPKVTERFKIFAVDLSKKTGTESNLDIQIKLLNDLVVLLNKELARPVAIERELKFFLKYIRAVCFEFSGRTTMMIDIVNWVKSINDATSQYTGRESRLTGVFRPPITDFLTSVSDEDKTLVLASTSGKKIYDIDGSSEISSVIALPPTGYSIFFPIIDCSNVVNLKDNILSDDLLKDFPDWKKFLNFINPEISNIFVSN